MSSNWKPVFSPTLGLILRIPTCVRSSPGTIEPFPEANLPFVSTL